MSLISEDRVLEHKKITTFVLVNRSDSDWTLRSTLNTPNPIHLNAPKTKNLTMTSMYCFGKEEGYAEIMYLEGSPTIFVNDVFVDKDGAYHPTTDHQKAEKDGWKLKKGIRTLYTLDEKGLAQKRKIAVQKLIRFDFGILSLDKYGGDPTLLEYVNCHEDNINAPNAKFNTRNSNKMWAFASLQEEKKAAKKLDTLDSEADALMYVASLRTKVKEGGYTYDQANINKIDATLRILDMKLGFQDGDNSQKHLAIRGVAAGNPVQFMEIINSEFDDMRMAIAKGIELKVLEMPSKTDKVVRMITGEKDDKKVKRDLITVSGDNSEDRIMELSIHFMIDKGITDYRDFTLLCDAARNK